MSKAKNNLYDYLIETYYSMKLKRFKLLLINKSKSIKIIYFIKSVKRNNYKPLVK